jgi:hypothetical protein
VDEMDTMRRRYGKAELLGEIDRAWTELNEALDRLTPEQMTEIRDPEGWAVKDHLVHMAAWERSVAVFLQGRPRHEGLGISEDLYIDETGEEDDVNAAIQEAGKDLSASEALADLRAGHAQMLSLINAMSDDDLNKANSDFQPDASGERDERPVVGMIYSNTANHFREHQGWIESLVSRDR